MSSDLQAVLERLGAGDSQPELFERISRWRLACGDAEAAGQWHYWSFEPPPPAELATALAAIWRGLGQPERMPATALQGWDQLAALLSRPVVPPGDLAQALELQNQLLADPPPLSPSRLLELAAAWKQLQQPAPAALLLSLMAAAYQRRGQALGSQLANALAELLEQLERYDEAKPWWEHSLDCDPGQLWPLMRLAHQAQRRGQPDLAVHYTQLVLVSDPQHRWAPPLQHQALQAMGARGSLAQLGLAPWPAAWQRRQPSWEAALAAQLPPGEPGPRPTRPVALLPPQAWAGQQQLALWGARDGHALSAWASALRRQPPRQPITLWLLASPEPLLLEQQLRALLGDAARVLSCPDWQDDRHAGLTRLFVAHRAPAPPVGPAETLQLWIERAGPHRWQQQP